MAYFAKLVTGNIVENVISINNSVITDANGVEQEQLGIDFINQLYNTNDTWKQTSYNNNIRKNYAGIGFQYDQTRDAFIPPKRFDSWVLNEDTCNWESPVPYPQTYTLNLIDISDNTTVIQDPYTWNEETKNWDLVTI
jgi:hypothetical protein